MNEKYTKEYLKELQGYPLEIKVQLTKQRIREWVNRWGADGVYVSYSGGKDSTVLLHIAKQIVPDILPVFVNTGLEYPSVSRHAINTEGVTVIKPEMTFTQVIIEYGYPVMSKETSQKVWDARKQAEMNGIDVKETNMYNRNFNPESDHCKRFPAFSNAKYAYLFDAPFKMGHKCCNVMKKHPFKTFERKSGLKPIIATMASESRIRKTVWLHEGCNAFESSRPISKPMSFWKEQDVLQYLKIHDLEIADAYGEIVHSGGSGIKGQESFCDLIGDYSNVTLKTTKCERTGCVFCLFGIGSSPDRFSNLYAIEPKLYNFVMRGGQWGNDGMWIPGNGGLGYWFVLKWLNAHGGLNTILPEYEMYEKQYSDDITAKYLRCGNGE